MRAGGAKYKCEEIKNEIEILNSARGNCLWSLHAKKGDGEFKQGIIEKYNLEPLY